ncbi:hypothetical protein DNHGIG_07970 [Collibacillus ludicampi]|uniref:Uncharacterized protein n=1 Tax=Collibacillus ludicampi TaxID=2771369 RepID=A0AAV4LBS7_9BACL|nr:hypothetical protein [Collibacillus ludicampi]GIM45248.1 hypothetical protein DNHGIG_07970 [Collibacillus ludicampi]
MSQIPNSQVAEQYVLNAYPCIQAWMNFVNQVSPNIFNFDSTSCSQIALISQSAMKTIDWILMNEPKAKVIRVSRMLCDLYETAWHMWVSFSAQSNNASGTRSLVLTSTALLRLGNFATWDNALNNSPAFSPPTLFNTILGGVTL